MSAFALTTPAGKVKVILFAEEGTNAVDVVNDIVAVSDVPGILLKINAVAASAVTAPTAGVVTLAAMVSFDVLITRPETTSGFDVSVISVHVTVTGPAARTASEANVIVMEPAAYFEVDLVAGVVMAHLSSGFADTSPAGNAIVILLAEEAAKGVEVVKEIPAVPEGPTALLSVRNADLTAPTLGALMNDPMVSVSVSILIPEDVPAKTASFGAKVNPEQVTFTSPATICVLT